MQPTFDDYTALIGSLIDRFVQTTPSVPAHAERCDYSPGVSLCSS
jgi:hypothetical protein